jgi:hypothetical protein
MAHGDTREWKWRGNWRMEWESSTLHTTSEHGVSNITTADAHTSTASSRLNRHNCRFKWTRPFRRKTKSGFCACAITFQTQSVITLCDLCMSVVFTDTLAYCTDWGGLQVSVGVTLSGFTVVFGPMTLAFDDCRDHSSGYGPLLRLNFFIWPIELFNSCSLGRPVQRRQVSGWITTR